TGIARVAARGTAERGVLADVRGARIGGARARVVAVEVSDAAVLDLGAPVRSAFRARVLRAAAAVGVREAAARDVGVRASGNRVACVVGTDLPVVAVERRARHALARLAGLRAVAHVAVVAVRVAGARLRDADAGPRIARGAGTLFRRSGADPEVAG